MSEALYRKYRPQTWSDLAGQNHIKVTLQNEIASDNITHAYLLTGPRGTGKTTTARLFSKAVNCVDRKEGESEPCDKCDACEELKVGRDLDLIEIDAASNTGVDNVRENIINSSRFTPNKRKYKIFIIDEVHMLSISAFNALLKVLEEPPKHVIFILATTEIHKIPATIISRCQRFDFHKISKQDLIKRLSSVSQKEGVQVDIEVLDAISRVSEGCLRDAESLLSQVLSLGEKKISMTQAELVIPHSNYEQAIILIKFIQTKNSGEAISLINKATENGVDLMNFTVELIELLRKIMLGKVAGSLKDFSIELDPELEKEIIDLSVNFELKDIIKLIELLVQKKGEIKHAVIPQLPLEMAVLEFLSDNVSGEFPPATGQPRVDIPRKDSDDAGDNPPPSSPPVQSPENTPPAVEKSPEGTTVDAVQVEPNVSSPVEKEVVSELIVQETTIENTGESSPVAGQSEPEILSNDSEESASPIETSVQSDELSREVTVTIEDIKNKWMAFIKKMSEINASLILILKLAEPLEINGRVLRMGFKYAFHQKKMNQDKVRTAVEEGLFFVYKENLTVDTTLFEANHESTFINEMTKKDDIELVDEVAPVEGGTQEDLIKNLVDAFGGKVVE